MDRLDGVDQVIRELDQVIVSACEPWAREIELLQTIPGVGPRVAQVIIAETGGDMSKFPTASHLASWAGLAPAMYESAGKRSSAGRRRDNKWLTAMLVEAAGSVRRAQIAVAHSILISAYYMLKRDRPYNDLGPEWLVKRNEEAKTGRLVSQLEELAHTVVINPAA